MSLSAIKTALAARLDTITDIATAHVFMDEPNTTPTEEQMPCIIVTLPRITPSTPTNSEVRCIYHFEILYLKHPAELAQPQEVTTAIDAYLSDVWTALLAALTLSGNATVGDFDGDVTRPLVQFRNAWYWGYKIPWRVEERASATFAA